MTADLLMINLLENAQARNPLYFQKGLSSVITHILQKLRIKNQNFTTYFYSIPPIDTGFIL